MLNVLDINSVRLVHVKGTPPELQTREAVTVNAHLAELVRRLSIDQPTWEFHLQNSSGKVQALAIRQDEQELGSVAWRYLSYNLGNGFFVSNDRISNQMSRGSGYKTTNIDKAAAKIKKMFKAKSLVEIAQDAFAAAESVIAQNVSTANQKVYQHQRLITEEAHKFILGQGFDLFLQYVQNSMPHQTAEQIKKAIESRDDERNKLQIVNDTRSALLKCEAVVVGKVDGRYVIKDASSDGVKIFTDEDLPADWRGKLGLLKLVEDQHYIENVGGRISESVFVLRTPKEPQGE